MPDIKPQYESLAQHAITLAREDGNFTDILVDEDVEWSLADMTIENAEWADNNLFVVHGVCDTSQHVQVSSGSRTHPPEYDSYDATVEITIAWYPQKNDGFSETEVTARQEGGAPSPPDPEPEWREI
jgi:hypothetical protein